MDNGYVKSTRSMRVTNRLYDYITKIHEKENTRYKHSVMDEIVDKLEKIDMEQLEGVDDEKT